MVGQWQPQDAVPVRVHEPLSLLDALEVDRGMHSWSVDAALRRLQQEGRGVAVFLNCGESADQLLAQFTGIARAAHAPERGRMDLRSYGVGAQILRDCGVHRMQLLGTPRRLPSMAGGYGLEVTGYLSPAEPRAFPCARCSRPGAACYGTRSLPSGVTRYRKCPRCAFTFVTHQPHPAPDGSVGPEVLS